MSAPVGGWPPRSRREGRARGRAGWRDPIGDDSPPGNNHRPVGGTMDHEEECWSVTVPGRQGGPTKGVISCGHFTVCGAAFGDRPCGVDPKRLHQAGPGHRRHALRLLPGVDRHGSVDQQISQLDSRHDQPDQVLGVGPGTTTARPGESSPGRAVACGAELPARGPGTGDRGAVDKAIARALRPAPPERARRRARTADPARGTAKAQAEETVLLPGPSSCGAGDGNRTRVASLED